MSAFDGPSQLLGKRYFTWNKLLNADFIFSCNYIIGLGLHENVQYIPRNMHTVFALLCFVMVVHWLIFPYPSGLLHWHCGNLTIAPVPAKQPWWIWINTSCEFIMNDCITTTKQSTTKPCAYFLGYTVNGVAPKLRHSSNKTRKHDEKNSPVHNRQCHYDRAPCIPRILYKEILLINWWQNVK